MIDFLETLMGVCFVGGVGCLVFVLVAMAIGSGHLVTIVGSFVALLLLTLLVHSVRVILWRRHDGF